MPIEIKIVGDNAEDILTALQDINKLFLGQNANLRVQDNSPIQVEQVAVVVPPTEDGARLKDKAFKTLVRYWELEHVKQGANALQKQFGVKRLREVPDEKGRELFDAVEKLVQSIPKGDA